ncbi:MAG: UvrD-helicase domain-containing protein [Clostridia bacterium]|nr:UvrD-helicase domain-containing protein [Clostridia bacterium]
MAFTAEQQRAIDSKGKVIVSASAGSGKTTVMIEKIIQLILKDTDVSDILAVTFTKKAASQMKDKLKRELIKAINSGDADGENRKRLKDQLALVPSADISTIHSFCAKLIRSHFFDAGVAGDFKIIAGDDADGTALKNRALDKVFEEAFAEDRSGDFFKLLSAYWRKKSDKVLREIFLKIYSSIRDRSDYRELLWRSGDYSESDFEEICKALMSLLKEKCEYYASVVEEYEYYFKNADGEKSAEFAKTLKEGFLEIASAPDYFTAIKSQKRSPVKERTGKRPEEYIQKLDELVYLRDEKYNGLFKEFAKLGTLNEEKQAFLSSGELARALGKYLLKFDEEYTALKRERNLLDYNDLEHISVSLLSDAKILEEIRGRYTHVFVDEYQDVNPVQEKIISLIGDKNVFLVGDLKQAIYGFRGSKSKYFSEKQAEYSAIGGESLHLSKNFRSSDKVLDAVNSQFVSVMTKENCGMDYAQGSIMQKGGGYPENSGRFCAHIFEEKKVGPKPKKEKEERILPIYSVREATFAKKRESIETARAIKEIIDEELGKEFYNVESKQMERVRYSDIVVLTRKTKGEIKDITLELSELGVPVISAAAVNICDYSEVKTLIDILSLLDNEEQDIPLVTALLSAMGGLDVNDLTDIRLAFREETTFRAACKRYKEEKQDRISAKLNAFYALYKKLRTLSAVSSVGEVLSVILSETQMEAEILARENGVGCLNRVRRFITESVCPEPLTLHEFLTRLKNLEYKIEYAESSGENSVQILTMHSSKGLEYPVVIVNATEKFRGKERAEVVVDEKFGIALNSYNPEKMTKRSTVLRRLYDESKNRDSIGDELNLYYVAMTRAKYALHLLFKERPPLCDVPYARSFSELTDFSVWEDNISYGVEETLLRQSREVEGGTSNKQLVEKIISAYEWQYLYKGGENLSVKNSATSIMNDVKAFSNDEYSVETLFEEKEDGFEWKGKSIGKEVGIAYHTFLEKFDFSKIKGVGTRENLLALINETLLEWKKVQAISDQTLGLLSAEQLADVLSLSVFHKLDGATLYKEQQFFVSLPVRLVPALTQRLLDDSSERILDEELLFQGAMDLLAVFQDGRAWIIDYKFSVKSQDALRKDYAPQLELYRKAVSRILKIDESKVSCSIVNVLRGFEISL